MGVEENCAAEMCAAGPAHKRGQRGSRCGGQRCTGWRAKRKAAAVAPISTLGHTPTSVQGFPPAVFLAPDIAAVPASAFPEAAVAAAFDVAALTTAADGAARPNMPRSGISVTSSTSEVGHIVAVAPEIEENEAASAPARRRVRFDLEAATLHEITPYAEIYGVHPRLFDFDKGFWMVPSRGLPDRSSLESYGFCGLGDDEDEESGSSGDESDEERY